MIVDILNDLDVNHKVDECKPCSNQKDAPAKLIEKMSYLSHTKQTGGKSLNNVLFEHEECS